MSANLDVGREVTENMGQGASQVYCGRKVGEIFCSVCKSQTPALT